MMVWNGRLCGATMFGLSGSSENAEPRLCSTKPYGGTVARLPYTPKTLWISDTMLPQRSAVVR